MRSLSLSIFKRLLTCIAGKVRTTVAGPLAAVMLIATPLVAESEGLRLKAYLDAVGIPTICYGETENVALGDVKTMQECDTLLAARLYYFALRVEWAVAQDMPPEMHAALASWTYNVGEGAMQKSTLVKLAHAGDFEGACNQLSRWVYAKGKRLNGLVIRREKERALCLSNL